MNLLYCYAMLSLYRIVFKPACFYIKPSKNVVQVCLGIHASLAN